MAWAAAVPGVLSLAGTAAKAGGQLKGGQATSSADLFKAQIANNNAIAYGQAATRAVQGGEVASDVAGLQTAATIGRTKATQAANGINVNTGSAVDVRAGQAAAGRINQDTTLSNAQLQGYGYRVRGMQESEQAQLDTAEAAGATAGAGYGAAGTILGGASALPWGWLKGGSGDNNVTPINNDASATISNGIV